MQAPNIKKEIAKECLIWLGIVAAAYISCYSIESFVFGPMPVSRWFEARIPVLIMMATMMPFVGIIHYYGLYRKTLARRKYVRYMVLLVPFAIVAIIINCIDFLPILFFYGNYPGVYHRMLVFSLQSVGLLDIPFILFYTAYRNIADLKTKRVQMDMQQEKTALLLLRNQLEPHFLFNTLNAAYAIGQMEYATSTVGGIESLSGLVRYATETAERDDAAIEHELKFAEQYLHLLRICNQSTRIRQNINWDRAPARITPMLLLPLLTLASDSKEIQIDIKAEQGILQVELQYEPMVKKGDSETMVMNIHQQLEAAYDHTYELSTREKEHMVEIRLKTKLNNDLKIN